MAKEEHGRSAHSGRGKAERSAVPGWRKHWFWWTAGLAGLVLRFALIPVGTRHGYLWDHDDFVRWGIQATDDGLTTLYEKAPPRQNMQRWIDGEWRVHQRTLDRVCNYPPGATYLLYTSGLVFKSISEDRLLNTVTARAVFSFWSIVADLLTAWGCAALVARFKPGASARWTFLLALLAPPLWWDSAVWGQMDAVFLAPAVWIVWAMGARRWLLAGALYGVAAALKPQAVLLLPVWALAMFLSRPFWRPLIAVPVAAVVVLATSIPFLLESGFLWFRRSYVENLLHAYPVTTLKAFNIWYIDALMCDSTDATATWSGITKDAWGKGLLLIGLITGFVWLLWRVRQRTPALVLWSTLSLLYFVMLPTRVHERYLVLVIPFLVVTAALWRRFWPGLLLLTIVATAQVTWPSWLNEPAGEWARFEQQQTSRYQAHIATVPPGRRDRIPSVDEYLAPAREQYRKRRAAVAPYEWLFTVVSLAGMVATGAATLSVREKSILEAVT